MYLKRPTPPSPLSLDGDIPLAAIESTKEGMALQKGQLATITGPYGTGPALILHVEQPGNLPSAQCACEMEKLRAILATWDIVELALIRQESNGRYVTYIASRNAAGAWRDLERRQLTITPLPFGIPNHNTQSQREES